MDANLFEVKHYDSIREMCSIMNLNKSDIMGDLSKENNSFMEIKLKSYGSIGIAYYNYGIKPRIEVKYDIPVLYLGLDKSFMSINYSTNRVIFHKVLDSIFYDYVSFEALNLILIIGELDVYVININGDQIWSIGFRDIIVDFTVNDSSLYVKINNGDETIFAIQDGAVIK